MEEPPEKAVEPPLKTLHESSLNWMQSYFKFYYCMQTHRKSPEWICDEYFNICELYQRWADELFKEPNQLWQTNKQFLEECSDLFDKTTRALSENISLSHIAVIKDKRFKNPLWSEIPQFFLLHQYYLLFSRHMMEFVKENSGKDPKMSKQIPFFTRQMLDAFSPANFIFTNPEVLKCTIESEGENLIQGAKNFFEDIARGQGRWAFKMTDTSVFEVGKNLAMTPGAIIYQNEMIQLIQYYPTTNLTYERPLLIIPPWINKYYILDLSEKNSFVKFCVEKGFTVFMISWVNPDKNYQKVSFEDYFFKGVYPAIEVIQKITSSQMINTIGFCIGGTLLASALGYLEAKKVNPIQSATFLATLIDFSDPGELEVFMDENQIATFEKEVEEEGFLPGNVLMMIFNLLRENELFWPYYINNYLLGKNPHSFDLLYWNSDGTNLPAKMFSDYARKLYLENCLYKGLFEVGGILVNLKQVQTDCYFLSTELDHIAPWESIFKGAQCLGGPVTFVLGQSGHIAGIVNPPSAKKYGYYSNNREFNRFNTSQEWLKNAHHKEGSWWDHWVEWIIPRSGEKYPSRMPGNNEFSMIQSAPGDYVKKHA